MIASMPMPRTFKGNAMAAGDATLKFSALTGCAGRTLVDLVRAKQGSVIATICGVQFCVPSVSRRKCCGAIPVARPSTGRADN